MTTKIHELVVSSSEIEVELLLPLCFVNLVQISRPVSLLDLARRDPL